MRQAIVAGIGGVIIGHIVWLLGISLARMAPSAHGTWVLLFSALFLLGAAAAVYEGWQAYRRQQCDRAAFLGGLAVSPVLFTMVVLGVTYL